MEKLHIYQRDYFESLPKPVFPCFTLVKTKWNDFDYLTEHILTYWSSSNKRVEIGTVKVLERESSNTILPNEFTNLDEKKYCSLGQANEYYSKLRYAVSFNIIEALFDALNDVAYNQGLLDDFEYEPAFQKSLIRTSEAQKALQEGKRLVAGRSIDNQFAFTFSTRIGQATKSHKIDFNFEKVEDLPNRINVIIGKNGTGKTQYIARLASTLSGLHKNGTFNTKYSPPFSRVLAVSYSLFDRFQRPKRSKTFSYHYCGLQTEKGFLSEKQIQSRIKDALRILEKNGRIQKFGRYLSTVLSDDITNDILDEDYINARDFSLYDNDKHSRYSSGQIIMLLILSEVVAYIREESLIIFDEPETHLHPNSISRFIEVIYKLLNDFNSYAIISTHSPQIIQEVPNRCIRVVGRIGDYPEVHPLDIETFGENLSTITDKVFHIQNNDEFYRTYFKSLSKLKDYKEIVDQFKSFSKELNLNAKIYLQSLYSNEKSKTRK